jgi:predicted DNA-binding transcriptional regulator AlpA
MQANQTTDIKPSFNYSDLKQFYTLREVSAVTGYSTSHIRAISKTDAFPTPVKLGASKTAWLISEINDWVDDIVKQRDADVEGV